MDTGFIGSRHSNRDQPGQHLSGLSDQPKDLANDGRSEEERRPSPQSASTLLAPEIPSADLSVDFSSETEKAEKDQMEKRKSNLLKLNEENEELRRKLKELNDRLEAAERKRAELRTQDQKGGGF